MRNFARQRWRGIGGLLATQVGGAWYFPAYDANGNITQYVDADGHVVASYTYDAFGNTVAESGAMASVFPFRFSTKYYDAESGLYYYGYRFYSPKLGRWLTRDPIEEAGGMNLYGFCGNDGVGKVDVPGRKCTLTAGPFVEEDAQWEVSFFNLAVQSVSGFAFVEGFDVTWEKKGYEICQCTGWLKRCRKMPRNIVKKISYIYLRWSENGRWSMTDYVAPKSSGSYLRREQKA